MPAVPFWRQYFPILFISLLFCIPAAKDSLSRDDYFHHALLTGTLLEGTSSEKPPLSATEAAMELFSFFGPDNQYIEDARQLGQAPWWIAPDLQIQFWRPLAALTHWADHQLWPDKPLLMHWHSNLWYVALVFAWIYCLRQFHFVGAAWVLAAALYLLDASHLTAIGWLANRNILISAACGILALGLYHRSTQSRSHPRLWISALLYLSALLSAEGGLAVAGFLASHALFLDQRPLHQRALWLLPFAAITLAWRGIYSQLGYAVANTGAYFDPVHSPHEFFANLLIQFFTLPMDQITGIESLQFLMSPDTLIRQAWVGGIFLGLFCLALWPLLRSRAIARFLLAGALISLIPSGSTLFSGNRLMFFSGAGFMAVTALFMAGVFQKADWMPKRPLLQFTLWVVAIGLLAINLAANSFIWYSMAAPVLSGTHPPPLPAMADIATDYNGKAEQLVIINPPSQFELMYAPATAQYHQLATPHYLRTLAPGLGAFTLSRTADNTLEVSSKDDSLAISPKAAPVGGKPLASILYAAQRADLFFAGSHYQMQPGHRIELPGVTISILEANKNAIPRRVKFEFEHGLDSSHYQWLLWNQQMRRYEPFTLPETAQSVEIPSAFEQ